VGLKNSLFALDWRKREHLVNVYKDLYKDNITWLSDPFSKTFWYHQEGELTILNQDSVRVRRLQSTSLLGVQIKIVARQ
jgi:hypothetical protein